VLSVSMYELCCCYDITDTTNRLSRFMHSDKTTYIWMKYVCIAVVLLAYSLQFLLWDLWFAVIVPLLRMHNFCNLDEARKSLQHSFLAVMLTTQNLIYSTCKRSTLLNIHRSNSIFVKFWSGKILVWSVSFNCTDVVAEYTLVCLCADCRQS